MSSVSDKPVFAFEGGHVREVYAPADNYVSTHFAALEATYSRPRVLQMSCREEEVRTFDNFYAHVILDHSITVVCTAPDEICASGPDHGCRLTNGRGKATWLHCRFHGRQWGLHGHNLALVNRDDWEDLIDEEGAILSQVNFSLWEDWWYPISNGRCMSSLSKARRATDPYQ